MPNMLAIVQHTPLWVFALFAVLVVLGVQSLRRRTVPVWRLVLLPVTFIGWGLITLAGRSVEAPALLVDWLVAAAVGLAIGWMTTRLDTMTVHPGRRVVDVPGSVMPLVRNLVIFAVKYGLSAAEAIAPARQASLYPWDVGVSGLMAGYFVGWLVRFAVRLRANTAQGPRPDSVIIEAGDRT
jgi:hypothetical protein